MRFLYNSTNFPSSIYNVGTSCPHTFNELAEAVFSACGKPPKIEYVEMPPALVSKYQYYTSADISKLRQIGYGNSFTDLTKGVTQYIE